MFHLFPPLLSNKYKYIAKTIFANFFTKNFTKKKWDLTKLFQQRISPSSHHGLCKLLNNGS
ncbi:hypothetical protein CV685_05965 [Borreliella burgdorferi]|nr:hypothetical protein CV688_06130 [Borreliella burgdorferi]PRQ97239.1 hypothetical protein CV681_06230 [Borreliella burgdorferi]PRR04729.1 hypothetical protein CV664_05965 [Borreliella burgdorferi]PRR31658.1 hypothetical protein CV692_06075 [Borreliella burgdorferi]PRR38019.1 hypothetical protein CV686_06175 [Borreliella burgdorferi]